MVRKHGELNISGHLQLVLERESVGHLEQHQEVDQDEPTKEPQAFNDLELVIPEDTPVRVTTDGFINLVDRRATDRALSGPTYRLRSDGAFNRIIIRSG